MLTAIRKVHLPKGPWVTEGGYEYNLALIALVTSLVETGPGRLSVDAGLFPRWKGTGWALASLAAAGFGSYLATGPLTEPEPAPEPEAMPEPELEAQPRFPARAGACRRAGRAPAVGLHRPPDVRAPAPRDTW